MHPALQKLSDFVHEHHCTGPGNACDTDYLSVDDPWEGVCVRLSVALKGSRTVHVVEDGPFWSEDAAESIKQMMFVVVSMCRDSVEGDLNEGFVDIVVEPNYQDSTKVLVLFEGFVLWQWADDAYTFSFDTRDELETWMMETTNVIEQRYYRLKRHETVVTVHMFQGVLEGVRIHADEDQAKAWARQELGPDVHEGDSDYGRSGDWDTVIHAVGAGYDGESRYGSWVK